MPFIQPSHCHRGAIGRFGCLCIGSLAAIGWPLAAAETPPEAPPPPAPIAVPAQPETPQLCFLLDYLYAQSAWNGDLVVPYRPDITLRLVDLLTPEEAKTFVAGPPPAAVVDGFLQAETEQGGALAQAYLEQLRALAAQLPAADQTLAQRLIDGMVLYQTGIHRANRLFTRSAPPRAVTPPTETPTQTPAPVNQGYRRGAPDRPPQHPTAPGAEETPPVELSPDDQERLRRQADRIHNEVWLRGLSSAELARVAAFLAEPRSDHAGVMFYDRTLRLYIGRTPVRLSDLFAAPATFRALELQADAVWRRRLVAAGHDWQKTIAALRSIAAQQQVARLPERLRPGLLAVLQTYHASLSAQQALQHQYESDLLMLTRPELEGDARAALEKRRDEFPNAMRALVEQFGRDLEAAWTEPLEQAVIAFYTRTKRLDYVKEHLHPQGKQALEKATQPTGDQF